jgi:Na+/melibiose symporter-like transporter
MIYLCNIIHALWCQHTNRKRDSESQVTSTNQLITEMQKEQQQRNEQIQQLQQAANNQVLLTTISLQCTFSYHDLHAGLLI